MTWPWFATSPTESPSCISARSSRPAAPGAVLDAPAHPYTRALLDAVPSFDRPLPSVAAARAGELPSNRRLPTGCFFRERCPAAAAGCEHPQVLSELADGRLVRCHRAAKGEI